MEGSLIQKEENLKNIYERNFRAYLTKGYSVIPDKYAMKAPAIKSWTEYCHRLPNMEEINSWNRNFKETGIAIALGKASGIVALDIDATNQDILDIVIPQLPESPVVKKGEKGETRFFKYTGELTELLKYNGEVVFEILSDKKKTTMPPSVHPNGFQYRYISDKTLLDVKAADLPVLPPYLISSIRDRLKLHIPETEMSNHGKIVNGRNDELVKLCGVLISNKEPVDTAIRKLVEHDLANSEVPLFTDPEEYNHTEPFSNALRLYTNVLSTVNAGHFRKQTEYEIPMTASAINKEASDILEQGKSPLKVIEGKSKRRELPIAQGVLKTLHQNILDNSFIKQPAFAFSAALATLSTLTSRKFQFQGMSPNLYLLNIAPSGAGKDAPQKKLMEFLIDINCEKLLGSGDYVSDASLVDGLQQQPVRIDIMDEAGGILRSMNSGKSDYNGKMADILAELYTSSTSKYLGRSTAEGRKGSCHRPNVNILASTTPTGFSEGISTTAIEKGLLGRFLIFQGDANNEAKRVSKFTKLDNKTLTHLRWLAAYEAKDNAEHTINGIDQRVYDVQATTKANERLDEIFIEFDNLRRNSDPTNPLLPIIARLYQQMAKICLIHSASRCLGREPLVNHEDVEFAYNTISYYYENIGDIVKKYIFDSKEEKNITRCLNIIHDSGRDGITKRKFTTLTRFLKPYERENIIKDLIEGGEVIVSMEQRKGEQQTIFRGVE